MSAAARSCVAYSTHRAGVDTLHSLPSRVLKLRKYVAFKPIISGSGCVVNDKESFLQFRYCVLQADVVRIIETKLTVSK